MAGRKSWAAGGGGGVNKAIEWPPCTAWALVEIMTEVACQEVDFYETKKKKYDTRDYILEKQEI